MESEITHHDYSVTGSLNTIKLSIEEWISLTQRGLMAPITIYLKGASMEPLIRYMKDSVKIIPVNRKLLEGDVVLFECADGKHVLHRIYKIIEDKGVIQTWGDNCYSPDPFITISSVIGIAVSFNRNGQTINLDSNEQRQKGLKWLNSKYKRYVWFTYRKIRSKASLLATRMNEQRIDKE